MDQKIQAKLDKKNELYEEMQALRYGSKQAKEGDVQASIAENITIAKLKRGPLRDKRDECRDEIRYIGNCTYECREHKHKATASPVTKQMRFNNV